MSKVELKRGMWRYRDESGRLHKFNTEQAALDYILALRVDDGQEEEVKEEDIKKEDGKKETNTDKQKAVFSGKSFGKKKV